MQSPVDTLTHVLLIGWIGHEHHSNDEHLARALDGAVVGPSAGTRVFPVPAEARRDGCAGRSFVRIALELD